MNRPSKVIVIAEDDRTHSFVWNFLKKLKYGRHHYTPRRVPGGSGEQFVRKAFANEVRAVRSRSASTALIVVVDADNQTAEYRFRQLTDSLRDRGIPARSETEPIAILIPKRNIETWIRFLTGEPADEAREYKPRSGSAGDHRMQNSVRIAADKFYELTRPNAPLPPGIIPTLERAVSEARRIPSAAGG
ncbi:MAG: hypothetical protein KJZ70_07455 [Bryobacterales bacterium]|nr:hypothetical protein [Bryobacterales bacterium]